MIDRLFLVLAIYSSISFACMGVLAYLAYRAPVLDDMDE
jgi:hypothetical protein